MTTAQAFIVSVKAAHGLGGREAQVCWLALNGVPQAAGQAAMLGVSVNTIKVYRRGVMDKLGADTLHAAAARLLPAYVRAHERMGG